MLAGIYLGIALLVVWLFGGFAALSGAFLDEVTGALQVLTLGFVFTLAMNAGIAVFLWLTDFVVIRAQGSQDSPRGLTAEVADETSPPAPSPTNSGGFSTPLPS